MLALDDDVLVRRMLGRLASSRDDVALEVVATPANVRARVLGALEHFDLVVCDFQLKAIGPGMTSEELVRELHARGVRVAVMTADVEIARAALGDLVPVLLKPVTIDDMLAHVRR